MFHLLHRLSKEGTVEDTGKALQAIQGKLPFMFAFLGHDDDDVSLASMDFTKEYISLLKQVYFIFVLPNNSLRYVM